MEVKPLSPQDMDSYESTREFPDFVIESFNQCIKKHWRGGRSNFTQDEVVALIEAHPQCPSRHHIFDERWLDVEPRYRAEGWRVDFDKPGYCENYRANFTFIRKGVK